MAETEAKRTKKVAAGRKSNGEASYRTRANGTWEGRFTTRTGEQKSVYGKTRKEATDKVKAKLKQESEGLNLSAKRFRVGDYLDWWLEKIAEPRVRTKTFQSYKYVIDLHLKPALGKHWLDELTPEHVDDMLAAKSKELDPATGKPKRSARTVGYMRVVLRTALAQALKTSLVTRNVAALATAPRQVKKRLTPLTPVQVRTLLAATKDDRYGPLYEVAVFTGLRQGELLGLEWRDVDLENRTLTVRQALGKDAKGAWVLGEPKSHSGRRTISLTALAVEALKRQRIRQKEDQLKSNRWDGSLPLVFLSTVGTPVSGHNVTHAFQEALEAAGLPRQRFHDLRHACISFLLAQGTPLPDVKEIAGHSQISLTANTYAHMLEESSRAAADRLDRLFG